jgi:hypothetical protein
MGIHIFLVKLLKASSASNISLLNIKIIFRFIYPPTTNNNSRKLLYKDDDK